MKTIAQIGTLTGLSLAVLNPPAVCVSLKAAHRPSLRAAPGKPLLLPSQAAHAAREYILKIYFGSQSTTARIGLAPRKPGGFGPTPDATHGTGLRCLAYCFPQGLVNWDAPEVTFLSAMNTPKYGGPGWRVHFIAPRRPFAPANVTEMPGDDFDVLLARDGRTLYTTQGYD